jgi:hypothetical protein
VTGIFVLNFYETRVLSGELETTADTNQTGATDPQAQTDERSRRGRRSIAREVQRFQDYLGLDEAQRLEIEAILEGTRAEFRELSAETRSEYDMIREDSRDRIRTILTTDEQRQKYEELVERQDRRISRRRDRD